MAHPSSELPSPGQRALWTFLIGTLVGPALAALIILVLTVGSASLGMGPPSLKTLAPGQLGPLAAQRTLEAYVWSGLPAGGAAALAAAIVALRGSLPWLAAVVIAGIAGAAAAFLAGGIAAQHGTPIAFIGALAGLGVWLILRRGRIVSAD
jgi:hypothetical protein